MIRKVAKNNKGLSLLEVLVAVFVLAIAAVPILNMFVTSSQSLSVTNNIGDTTYLAQSVMEDLYPLKYSDLFSYPQQQNYQVKSVVNSSTVYVTKKATVNRYPYGSFNYLVSGTACYAHLIITGGTATFTGPDGTSHSGIALSATPITMSSSQITIGGNTWNLNKPAGTSLILIINAGSSAIPAALTINLTSDVVYVLYALSATDTSTQNITVNDTNSASKAYRKYSSSGDLPPSYMLVNVTCKVYAANGTTVDSLMQDTLKVNLQ